MTGKPDPKRPHPEQPIAEPDRGRPGTPGDRPDNDRPDRGRPGTPGDRPEAEPK